MSLHWLLGLFLLVLTAVSALATDKNSRTLFGPTPRTELRELAPDRPDTTENPVTLDAGHFAMEVTLFDFRKDGADKSYTVMSTNMKLGLNNSADFQMVFDSYTFENRATGSGAEGFGDVQLRLKWNLWGNDEGDSALALLPFVKIPTGTPLSNGAWEGGLIVPFSMQLTDRIGLGLMAELDRVYTEETRQHTFEFLHTAVLGIDLTERVGSFIELIGITGTTGYQLSGAAGFTFTIHKDLILDCGCQFGLNNSAEDLGAFLGFTRRFSPLPTFM